MCNHIRPFRMLLCLPLVWQSCAAAPATTLRLADALAYGLAHSPQARNAALEEDIARTRIGQAGAQALPQLSLNATYTRLDEVASVDLGEGAFALGSLDNYEVAAGISQILYSGGQVSAAWRAARITRVYATENRRAFEANLVFEIIRSFHAVLLARETLKVQEASLDMLQAFETQTRQRQQSGAASDFDSLTAAVRVANARPGVIAASNQLALARSTLATRLHFKDPFEVVGELSAGTEDRSLPELQAMALQQRPERELARLGRDLAREAITAAHAKARPEVRLFANTTGGNASQFAATDDWDWRWHAGVSATWNLWDGNLTRQTVRQRQIEQQQQENLLEDTEAMILLEVEQAWLALEQARQALAASSASVELAERALTIARTRYDAGLSTYLELTDANLALREAELLRLQATHDHANAIARIHVATGTPCPHLPAPPPAILQTTPTNEE